MELNDSLKVNMFRDSPWPGNVLSNFAATPFILDGINCSCSEAFIQSLKCSSAQEQKEFCGLSGLEAWEKGSSLTDLVFLEKKIWWLGKTYPLHSKEHFELVERGLRAKFFQSSIALEALVATGNSKLIHDYGQKLGKKQSLPVEIFCSIVEQIRTDIQGQYNA